MKKDLINLSDEIFCDLTEKQLEERFEFVKCGAGYTLEPCMEKVTCQRGYVGPQ